MTPGQIADHTEAMHLDIDPPALNGQLPTAALFTDGQFHGFVYGWPWDSFDDNRQLLEREGIVYRQSARILRIWRVDGRWRGRWQCGTVRHGQQA